MDQFILHITNPTDWAAAKAVGTYTADSLKAEGFIHCSTLGQVVGVVNQWFKGQSGLLLLVLDTAKLNEVLKYEDLYNHGDEFPHLYGPLNLDAVVAQVAFEPNADGLFEFPEELSKFA